VDFQSYAAFVIGEAAARALLRERGTPYGDLGLGNSSLSDDALLDAMLTYPILINRPIVVTSRDVRLCRPSEEVRDLLESPVGRFVKEDGDVVEG
jgi:arsenate reductase